MPRLFSVVQFCKVTLVALMLVLTTTALTSASEVPQNVRFSEVLPAKFQKGVGYSINNEVRINDNRYLFEAQTDYGGFSAKGLPMLELRLQEHHAIEQLNRIAKQSQIIGGIADVVRETPRGAMTLLKDPLGSLRRIPAGVKRNVGALLDPLERRAGSQARRDLAWSVGADPETRNPVLSGLLDKIALREDIGRIGAQVGIGFALPGIGLLSTTEDIRHKLQKMGPRDLAKEVNQDLLRLGISEPVSQAFAESRILTSTEKWVFVSHMRSLKGVQGLESLVAAVLKVPSESHLLSKFEEARVLAQLHKSNPIKTLYFKDVPVAYLHNGQFIAVTAVDLVCQTDSMTADISNFRRANPEYDVTVLVTGRMTDSAKALLRQARIRVYESKETIQR